MRDRTIDVWYEDESAHWIVSQCIGDTLEDTIASYNRDDFAAATNAAVRIGRDKRQAVRVLDDAEGIVVVQTANESCVQNTLDRLGALWTQGDIRVIARQWVDAGIGSDRIKEWAMVGIRQPGHALLLEDAGFSPLHVAGIRPRFNDEEWRAMAADMPSLIEILKHSRPQDWRHQ